MKNLRWQLPRLTTIIIIFSLLYFFSLFPGAGDGYGSETKKPASKFQQVIGTVTISENWRLFLPHEMYVRHKENSLILWNSEFSLWITQFNTKQSKVALLTDMRKRVPPNSKITVDESNDFYHLFVFEQPVSEEPAQTAPPTLINGHAIADDSFLLLGITCSKAEAIPAVYSLLRTFEYKILEPRQKPAE